MAIPAGGGVLKKLGELLREPAGPKPTLDKPWTRVWEMSEVRGLDRSLTVDDRIRLECMWAGQLGHEQCGWCRECKHPRWMKVKAEGKKEFCPHPFDRIYKGE